MPLNPGCNPAGRIALRSAAIVILAVICGLWVVPVLAQDDGGASEWYSQSSINEGLGPAPNLIDRDTPRTTVRGFLNAARENDFERAAHFLNLTEVPQEAQSRVGPLAARQLAEVIQRQVWIDWSDLSARPDAIQEVAASSDPLAGQPRRNIRIARLEANDTLYDIRIGRYRAGDDRPVWLFTPQTVRNIPPLYDTFGPRRYEAYIPQSLKREVSGLWLWEWIALPLIGALTLLLGWGTRSIVLRQSRRTKRGWLEAALERSGLPLAMLVMAGFVQILLHWVLTFSGPVNAILRPILTLLMVWGVGMAMLRVVDAVLKRVTLRFVGDIDDKRGADEREIYTSIYALRRLILLVMVGFAIVIVMNWLNLFDTVGMALLASAGVLTVIAGIAGQAVLGNIMASLQIAFAKPVRIGDSVLFEGDWAYVESIYYTFLRLRTWDHRRIVVPVTYFISKPFENWSVTEAKMMKVVKLTLDHRADVGTLREQFEKLIAEDEDIMDDDPAGAFAYATNHGPDGLEVSFYAMMPDPSTGWSAEARLREQFVSWIAAEHPEWWPRERVMDAEGDEDGGGGRKRGAASIG
ncbi:mechanosensitive ion channel family protein [Citreimonas salinaria]|uniref:Small-conductance mechanosensitive channel n=1 Tax=Citreimonas salinaria TaxID=321339 RepID=A0A1H3J2Y9_9RHOB|nr:mechanosensitive ion channel family protein [Citreimonas salinaria]SDY34301.1 Small-conductance mechanosensitive channel [Citreimonas salinaria]